MAILKMSWDDTRGAGADLHVVQTHPSRPLTELLGLRDGSGAFWGSDVKRLAANSASLKFEPRFKGAPFAHFVQVDLLTGQVTILPGYGTGDILRNFLVYVRLMQPPSAPEIPALVIRVHLHSAFDDIWLTPAKLTVPFDSVGQRLSIYARFTDGVVANLSWQPGVTWSASPSEAGAEDVKVDGSTGVLTPLSLDGAAVITASVPGVPAPMANPTARVECAPPWGRVRQAVWINGPSPDDVDKTRNVLFLAEGFVGGERTAFVEAAHAIVRFQEQATSLFPWNHIVKNINFWALFLESPGSDPSKADKGASVRYGMRLEPPPPPDLSSIKGYALPSPVAPRSKAEIPKTIEQLIHEVGLPVPSDANAAQFDKANEWARLYDFGFGFNIKTALFQEWRDLAGYGLADEKDTALGIAFGETPRARLGSPPRHLGFHEFRTTRADIDRMLENLTDELKKPIGKRWLAEDRKLVIAIVAGPRSGGTSGDLLYASLFSKDIVFLDRKSAHGALEAQRPILPDAATMLATADRDAWGTFIHEAAHSFRLGDEYVEPGLPEKIPSTEVPDLLQWANVQASGPPLIPSTGLDVRAIKWNWPRILRAAVTTAYPKPNATGDGWDIDVVPGQAVQFMPTEESPRPAYLRSKDLLPKFPAPKDPPRWPTPYRTSGMFVSNVNPALNRITLAWVETNPGPEFNNDIKSYPPGSVLIEPHFMKKDDDLIPLRMVSPVVEAALKRDGYPLNLPLDKQAGTCVLDDTSFAETQFPARLIRIIPFLKTPAMPSQIIGLYSGGARYACGTYHPAGACMMRWLPKGTGETKENNMLFRFCHVCRYCLVDQLDPALHEVTNTLYEIEYAK